MPNPASARARLALPRLTGLALALVCVGALAGDAAAESRWAKHYRERVEAFRAENETLPTSRRYVVLIGDSITEGFPLKRYFGRIPALNRGISSDRVGQRRRTGVLHRLPESVYDTHPAVVLLLIGVNDLTASPRPGPTWIEGIRAIVARIRARCPKAKLVLQTLLPVGRRFKRHAEIAPKIRALNKEIRALARRTRGVRLLDLYELYRDPEGYLPDDLSRDGLHPKAAAYRRWADAVLALPGLPAPLPRAPLQWGDRGPKVEALQRALERLGYRVGTVDGVFGGRTEAALKAFQRDQHLPPSGDGTKETLSALQHALRLKRPPSR